MIFLGLYLARVMGTKVLPNEPVPPVTRMVELFNIIICVNKINTKKQPALCSFHKCRLLSTQSG